jgi:hypothetical protein
MRQAGIVGGACGVQKTMQTHGEMARLIANGAGHDACSRAPRILTMAPTSALVIP